MKRNLVWLVLVFLIFFFFGCGGGSTSAITGGGGGSDTLPTTPGGQVSYGQQKVSQGDYASAKSAFEAAKNNAAATDSQKRLAATGVQYCDIKLGYVDIGDDQLINDLLLVINPATTTFAPSYASTSEVSIPMDAYQLLGMCYMVRNKSGDNAKAVTYLSELGGGESSFNPNYVYTSELGIEISNAESHALLAMAYFYIGEEDKSKAQLTIAKNLDSKSQYQVVTEISNALTIMGF